MRNLYIGIYAILLCNGRKWRYPLLLYIYIFGKECLNKQPINIFLANIYKIKVKYYIFLDIFILVLKYYIKKNLETRFSEEL